MALFLASPAGANAAGIPGPAGVWRWLEGLWADRIGDVTRNWTAPRPAASPSPAAQAKDLVCPPTGCPTTPTQQDQGGGLDPDGRPH
jgi:hypothetical protein